MNSSADKTATPSAFQRLAHRCIEICEQAKAQEANLPAEREPFLYGTLGDLMQQLELVLRLVEEESEGSERKDQRRSLLRRLLKPTEDDAQNPEREDIYLPDFDVSQQGLHGNSLTVPLSDLVGFLAYGGKSGVLWVDGAKENFLLGLVDGKLMHATSDQTPEGLRLGEILVGLGYLTRRQLERFLLANKVEGGIVAGEMLVHSGLISEEELNDALVHQIKQLFYRLVDTRHAIFRFREGLEVQLAHQVDLDINQLLLNVARVQDEARIDEPAEEDGEHWNTWRADLGNALGTSLAAIAKQSKEAPDEQARYEQAPHAKGEKAATDSKDAATSTSQADSDSDKGSDANGKQDTKSNANSKHGDKSNPNSKQGKDKNGSSKDKAA